MWRWDKKTETWEKILADGSLDPSVDPNNYNLLSFRTTYGLMVWDKDKCNYVLSKPDYLTITKNIAEGTNEET